MRARGLVATVLAILASACGGSGSGDEGDVGCAGLPDALCRGSSAQAPPAQGAFALSVKPLSPAPVGKSCPTTGFTTEAPASGGLDADTYVQHVADGEEGASVTCSVQGSASFAISAKLVLGGRRLVLDGMLTADRVGEAGVTLTDSEHLSGSLVGASCTLDAQMDAMTNRFQVKAGSIWAGFSCPTVEAAPNTACAASGYFVIENCRR